MEDKIKVTKGSAIIYRVFDVGNEITLPAAAKLFETSTQDNFGLVSDTRKAIIIKNAPLRLNLGEQSIELGSKTYSIAVGAKIWHYGVISVAMTLSIEPGTSWRELISLAAIIEESRAVEECAAAWRDRLVQKMLPAIAQPSSWQTIEDYVTWVIEKYDGVSTPAELMLHADVPALILAEHLLPLSDSSRGIVTENALQYSANDLAVIDWNSALLIEPAGSHEVADVIEFCLTHLLEMRYYDSVIEGKLNTLYDSLETKKVDALSNFYARLARDAGRQYMEFSEFLGRIENSIKTVGDFYLATVFRMANREFRFNDWRDSVDRKMETLARISQVLNSEVNTRRSVLLEIIVILLIAIELVPFFNLLFR
jgi:hypothetical protein